MPQDPPLLTLPDHLAPGLDVVFVGINPGLLSARLGHYFARRTNRFWPAFSRSRLSLAARQGLGVAMLEAAHDAALLPYGFGFTDLVKRATAKASDLAPGELEAAAPALLAKLETLAPRLACFHGVTGWRPFRRAALGREAREVTLGLQPETIGRTHLFVVPSPSAANAHETPAGQTLWYDRLAECRDALGAR